jgi:hypothetical protein
MRTTAGLAAAVLLLAACDQVDALRGRRATAEPPPAPATAPLALGLQAPGAIEHGQEGVIRISLTNRGDTLAQGVRLELLVPTWMEPMPPRPGDAEVTMAAEDETRTRFAYRGADSLAAGETRVIEQRVRAAPSPERGVIDWSRVVRARLLSAAGQPLAEVETEVPLRSAAAADTARPAPAAAPPTAPATGPGDTLPVRGRAEADTTASRGGAPPRP